MAGFFKIALWILLIWSSYHLTRDILQDVLGIHNPIIDVLHMRPVHNLHWLGRYYHFWGMPIETLVLILSVKGLTSDEFSLPGSLAVGLFATFLSFWAWASFK